MSGAGSPGSAPSANRDRYGRAVSSNPTSRDYNKASVLDVLLFRAPLTSHELIELTGLSRATVYRAVEEVRADGFVIDGRVDATSGRGRRSTYLDVPRSAGHVVGISFGAQTTGAMVTDLRGREIEHVILPSVDHPDVKSAAVWLVELIARACESAEGPLRQIVIAVPGRVREGREVVGPAEAMKIFAGVELQRSLVDLVDAPVLLESDANAALLGIMIDDATIRNAALFNVSSTLNFASCTDHEIVRGRTSFFGDIGVLFSGVDNETLDGLLSTSGLLRFARGRGLNLQRIDDLWLERHDEVARGEVLEAFTTAIVTAVSAVAVTLDPEAMYFVGQLRPLVDEVLPELRGRLDKSHLTGPEIKAVTHVLGLSTARGAVYACLTLARDRLRDEVLESRRRGQPAERSVPAF